MLVIAAIVRCLARSCGYCKCPERFIAADDLNSQVVDVLSNLVIPDGMKERVEFAVRSRIENEPSFKRRAEIEEVIKRVDLCWDEGFISKEQYLDKRRHLQQEFASQRPFDFDELTEAADLLENFRKYWGDCETLDDPGRGTSTIGRQDN